MIGQIPFQSTPFRRTTLSEASTDTTNAGEAVRSAPVGAATKPKFWTARDFEPPDLEPVVELWRGWQFGERSPVYALSDVVSACDHGLAVVVTDGEEVVGAAAATVVGNRAWIIMLAQHAEYRDLGVGSALLAGIESRLTSRGIFVVSAMLPAHETRSKAFRNSGFGEGAEMRYFERKIPVEPDELGPLAQLSGRILPRTLWDSIAGMSQAKQVIESRIIMPIVRADVAHSLGVIQPRTVVLFGPPGTGKTTFAKAIASRLSWPFVELHPSTMASEPGGLAAALRSTFEQIAELKHGVVFIDEVEEIASRRSGDSAAPSATNELLKLIPAFRERDGRLFVCATNFVRSLDPAFLRHGRFDYVLPIGLPDEEARRAIWRRYIPQAVGGVIDVDALASATDRFSPADIEYSARRASQRAFERTLDDLEPPVAMSVLDTEGYLDAIRETRPTVSPERLAEFLEDIQNLGRS